MDAEIRAAYEVVRANPVGNAPEVIRAHQVLNKRDDCGAKIGGALARITMAKEAS